MTARDVLLIANYSVVTFFVALLVLARGFKSVRQLVWTYVHGRMIWRGSKVLFVEEFGGAVRCGYVSTRGTTNSIDYVYFRTLDNDVERLRFDERGTTWCFGWEGEDANALRAARALT